MTRPFLLQFVLALYGHYFPTFLWRQQSRAPFRDHFVRRPSVTFGLLVTSSSVRLHIYVRSHIMTKITLIVTLNKQFTHSL